VEYEGIKKYHDPLSGIEETIVDPRKDHIVTKELRTLTINNVLPKTVYTFNISAKFIDASWGPVNSIRVETGSDGMSFAHFRSSTSSWCFKEN
jgi:hypothetical protein